MPNRFEQPAFYLQSGDPETENAPTLAYPGQLGVRFTVIQPTRAAVFHLAGTRDEYYGPARVENYAQQLRQRAEDVEFRSYDAGHEISPAMRDDIREWLASKSGV